MAEQINIYPNHQALHAEALVSSALAHQSHPSHPIPMSDSMTDG